jgi:hypothetical protein
VSEAYSIADLSRYLGHEVVDANGESVGYVDLVFVDDPSGRPEWLGVWNGVWETRPRILVPLQRIDVSDDQIRVPWTKDVIKAAPAYTEEDDRGVLADHAELIGISPEKEREAYSHYGIEQPAPVAEAARLRATDAPVKR